MQLTCKARPQAAIDPIRRAEIGRQSLLLRVRCSARQAVDSVTVDDVVRKVGGRKRTFYVHFKDLPELTAAVVDELVEASDDLLHQSGSQSTTLRSALPSAVVASSIGRWPIPVGPEWRRGWSSCWDEPAAAKGLPVRCPGPVLGAHPSPPGGPRQSTFMPAARWWASTCGEAARRRRARRPKKSRQRPV